MNANESLVSQIDANYYTYILYRVGEIFHPFHTRDITIRN